MCFKHVQECILPKKIKLGVGCTFKNSSENHTKVVHNMHGTHYPHLITLSWALQEDKHLLRLFSVLLLDAFLSPHQMTFSNFRFAMHLKQIPKAQLLNLSGAFRLPFNNRASFCCCCLSASPVESIAVVCNHSRCWSQARESDLDSRLNPFISAPTFKGTECFTWIIRIQKM